MTGSRTVAALHPRRWLLEAGVAVLVVVLSGLLILFAGADPFTGLRGLIEGFTGSPYRFGELLVNAMPTAIIALTLIPALRAGIFSVGAEGQLIVGATTATAALLGTTAALGDGVPAPVLLLIGAAAGCAGGIATALLPALLSARWNVNIILSTLLLNYVAAGALALSLRTWLGTDEQTATPQSPRLPDAASLPILLPGTRAHWGLLIVLVLAVALVWWSGSNSSTRLRLFASRPLLAQRLGATASGVVYRTMLVSGAGAGLVGWIQVAGVNQRLMNSVSGGVGFSGIAVALLGALIPLGVVAAALFFSALTVGAIGMQAATGTVPTAIAEVIKGVLLLGVAAVAGIRSHRPVTLPPADPAETPADRERADREREVTT